MEPVMLVDVLDDHGSVQQRHRVSGAGGQCRIGRSLACEIPIDDSFAAPEHALLTLHVTVPHALVKAAERGDREDGIAPKTEPTAPVRRAAAAKPARKAKPRARTRRRRALRRAPCAAGAGGSLCGTSASGHSGVLGTAWDAAGIPS